MKPAMTPQQEYLSSSKKSGLTLYREFAVGNGSFPFFLGYELVTLLCSNLPGLLGYGLRSGLYPLLLGRCGRRPAVGRGVVIRNPRRMILGDQVLLDDYAVLDVRGQAGLLALGDHVSIGRFTTVAAKDGSISLAAGVNIGSYCRVATQSRVTIGESVLVAAYCYIGPGNHQSGDGETPLIARAMAIKGGVEIGAHAWIGAHSTILDGVKIGAGAVVGAHSLVREDVPAGAVVAGVPARVLSASQQITSSGNERYESSDSSV